MLTAHEGQAGTPEDFGLQRRPTVKETVCGKMRPFSSLYFMEWTFLLLSLLSVLASIGLCIVKIVLITQTPAGAEKVSDSEDFTFAILLIVNSSFCAYYVIHGVLWERPYELVLYVVGVVIVSVYLVINFVHTDGWTDVYKTIRLIAGCSLAAITLGLGIVLSKDYYESGRVVFYSVGAIEELQSACKLLFATEAVMKLDLQLQASMLVLIVQDKGLSLMQTLTLALGFPFSVICFFLGFYMMRMELRWGCRLYLLLGLLEPAYVVYKLVEAGINITSPLDTKDTVVSVIFAVGALALVFRLFLFLCVVLVMRNFNKGLKHRLAPKYCCWPQVTPSRRRETGYGAAEGLRQTQA